MNTPILDGLKKYKEEQILRFHMPGHYGRMLEEMKELSQHLMEYDVTEVPGTDNLGEPKEMIKASLESIQKVYGSYKSYYLVNGSTSGIQIAIDSLLEDGGHLLIGRNAHKSVFHMIQKKKLQVSYLSPRVDEDFGIESHMDINDLIAEVEQLEKENKPLDVVLLTYPNYYGRCYDLPRIHQYLKEKNIPLIVDGAHSAHFAFSKNLPLSPVGHCDICVMSLHKTLPALTQTALLHLGNLTVEQQQQVEKNVRHYLTSSPSYLMMASSEIAVAWMDEHRNELDDLWQIRKQWEKRFEKDPRIQMYKSHQPHDFCKLLIRTAIAGEDLGKMLREQYAIQCEMALGDCLLLMLGVTHGQEDLQYLGDSLERILQKTEAKPVAAPDHIPPFPRLKSISPKELERTKAIIREDGTPPWKEVGLEELEGAVCAEDIIPYPPGIPLVLEGEIISQEGLSYLKKIYPMHQEFKVFK